MEDIRMQRKYLALATRRKSKPEGTARLLEKAVHAFSHQQVRSDWFSSVEESEQNRDGPIAI
jgi:hypothetical protein